METDSKRRTASAALAAVAAYLLAASPLPASDRRAEPQNRHPGSSAENAPAHARTQGAAGRKRAGAKEPLLRSPDRVIFLGRTEPRYTGEPISLDLKDADLRDVLLTFSKLTGLNIVIDPDVKGSVTVRLHDVPWDQALEVILRSNGLGEVLDGNVARVGPPGKL
jgi:type IV pilus assembly protein PilQ